MTRFMEDLNFFIGVQKMSWKSFLTYRAQALVWGVADALTIVNMIIAITVIYDVSSGIPGWTYFQVLALSSAATMMFGIVNYAITPWTVVGKLRRGMMDMWFTKPYGYLLVLSGASLDVTAFVDLIGGFLLFVYAALHLSLQAVQLAYFAALFIAGTVAVFMFMSMMALLSYRLFKSAQFVNEMENMLGDVGRYPISIYGIAGQLIFTLAMPIGLAYYYSTEALLGIISPVAVIAIVILAVAMALVSRRLLYKLLESYSSGGG